LLSYREIVPCGSRTIFGIGGPKGPGCSNSLMEQLPKRRSWLPSPALLIFVVIGVIAALVLFPVFYKQYRESQIREASAMLKAITSAEADFRANDRDRNKVQDYWTADVSGLYYVQPRDGGPEIRLIDEDVANADAKPSFSSPRGTAPHKGYLFQALDRNDSIEGEKGIYQVDTDQSGRKVHNLAMFGFIAFPSHFGMNDNILMVNENNTRFRFRVPRLRTTWPTDQELMKLDANSDY
jgi:hypothetical protein